MDLSRTEEQLKAEYHLMKNNLNLAMRENEVVKGENRICKSEIRQLKKDAAGLRSDIVKLNRNYEQDMTRMHEQYGALEIQYKTLEEKSNAKIQELTDLNTNTLQRLSRETVQFNLALNRQKAEFRAEREALKADFSRKTKEYEGGLNDMAKRLAEKETENDSLNSALAQAAIEIEKLKSVIADGQTKIGNMQKTTDVYRAGVADSLAEYRSAVETVKQAPKQ